MHLNQGSGGTISRKLNSINVRIIKLGYTRYEEVLSYMFNNNTILVLRDQKEFAYRHHISEESILILKLRELGVLRDE